MKKIIAVDFDGTLIKNKPSKEAHYEWFNIMAYALKDNSIKKYAGKKDYFKYVYKIMARYTGLDPKNKDDAEIMRRFARNLFQMLSVALANKYKKDILVKDFAKELHKLKKKYFIAIITSSPEDSVIPILKIIKKEKLFDMVCKSSLKKEPNKIEVFREFIGKYGKPICYIGNSDYDMEACKKLKIPSILATWDKVGGEKEAKKLADYVISNPKQIRKIIEDIEESRKSSDFLDPENRRFSRK